LISKSCGRVEMNRRGRSCSRAAGDSKWTRVAGDQVLAWNEEAIGGIPPTAASFVQLKPSRKGRTSCLAGTNAKPARRVSASGTDCDAKLRPTGRGGNRFAGYVPPSLMRAVV